MTTRSLAQRTDAILAAHTGSTTVHSVTAYPTCPACDGPLHVDRITGGDSPTRHVHHTCTDCGALSVLTVSVGPPRLPWPPVARHLPKSLDDAARLLKTPTKTLAGWRRDGIPVDAADDLCDRLQVHPSELWPRAHYLAAAELEAAA